MDKVKPKKSLVKETYDILVDAICAREFLPGQRLNQDDIAAQLNVSRQPVNSAIAILKTEQLVEDTGRRGVMVTELDPHLFKSICEYRMVIEPFAVRRAAAQPPEHAAAEAAEILTLGKEATRSGDIRALLQADRQFHEMIYRWSGNLVIQSSMRTNWNHIQRAMAEVLRDPSKAVPIWEEHQAIISSLLAGRADEAAELMAHHIQSAYDENLSSLFDGATSNV